MRVLHVLEVTHGGVPAYVRSIAEDQVASGIEVSVLAPPAAGDFSGAVFRWAPRRRRPLTLALAAAQLRRLSRSGAFDVIHLHSFFPGVLGRVLPLRARVVYQPHGWAFAAAPSWARWVPVMVERRFARTTSRIVVNCSDERLEGHQTALPAAFEVVGTPVDLDEFRPATLEEAAAARARMPGAANRKLVCVGRLSRQKGQIALAEAWEAGPVPGADLVFVGPGDSEVLRAAAPRTFGATLFHVGPRSDVRSWLWGADLCVMPSLYEGQSLAMAEAMATGMPIVMSDVSGARDAIVGGASAPAGAVVARGDLAGLVTACERLMRDVEELSTAGEAARERATALFDRVAVSNRLIAAYRGLEGTS